MAEESSRTMQAIQALWERYKDVILARVNSIEEAERALRDNALTEELRKKAHEDAHKLAGSMGTFGFAEATRRASAIELLLDPSVELGAAESDRLSELVEELRQHMPKQP